MPEPMRVGGAASFAQRKEWEWAASGGEATRLGDKNQPKEANTWQGLFPVTNQVLDGFAGTAPVACFKANNFGLFDMIGNVWELTSDPYTESHNPQDNVPPDQSPTAQRSAQPGRWPRRPLKEDLFSALRTTVCATGRGHGRARKVIWPQVT